jgi:flagellar biosynthesis GTPase FlhF
VLLCAFLWPYCEKLQLVKNLQDDVDELFKLPLTEFTDARNALAKRLKQNGRANDANVVRTLTKPSVSAWTVNQLYWHHRDAFEELLAAGQRFRKAQRGGKVADMRGALDARRQALVQLSDLASSLLNNPTPDMVRRVSTTLEAMSALASFSDGPTPGRLSQDVDPPGFESLASFVPAAKPAKPATEVKATATRAARQIDETRQVRIAAAKVSLQAARKALADARARSQSLESAQKKAHAEAKEAEKRRREAEERFKKASAAADAATERSQTMTAEAQEATKAIEDAKRAVENASKELESLFSEPVK